MQTQPITHWTTQYANTLESAIDDGDSTVLFVLGPLAPGLTYAEWFNTRRHVTEYPRRREYVWLVAGDLWNSVSSCIISTKKSFRILSTAWLPAYLSN